MNKADLEVVEKAINRHKDEAIQLLQDIVKIPSVNHPPTGDEKEVQEFYFQYLKSTGLECEIFEPNDVIGFKEHPGRLNDHDMTNRPDVVGILKGNATGKSIMLIAHADVEVPGDRALWTGNNPFSGAVRQGKIYGRGVGDDKSGMAINAMVPRILQSAGIRLHGDLIIVSVSDEEQEVPMAQLRFWLRDTNLTHVFISMGAIMIYVYQISVEDIVMLISQFLLPRTMQQGLWIILTGFVKR